MDDGSDGDVFSCPAVYCCSAVQRFSGKNHFSEGKVLLQRAAAQAEQLSVDVMMPLLFL